MAAQALALRLTPQSPFLARVRVAVEIHSKAGKQNPAFECLLDTLGPAFYVIRTGCQNLYF
jgi:hypothetical protein